MLGRESMTSYSDTLDYIFNLRGGEIDLRLHRVARALSLFDHPEGCYSAFHIAGTNGKGSTAAMLHRILIAQGYRTGLYTSPHVSSFTERIQVDGREICPEQVVELANQLRGRLNRARISLTFFEFVTVMALVHFAHCKVNVAVVEVGMGGRLDATNLVSPEVSIITTIAIDHEAYLGSDLGSIAREKGGIIKGGVPVITGPLPPEAWAAVEEISQAKGSANYFLGRDFSVALGEEGVFAYEGFHWRLTGLSLALHGAYQRSNAALALAALEVSQVNFPVKEAAIREGLDGVCWPGRFEIFDRNPTVILDGAHNMQGVKALVEEIHGLMGGKRVIVLFGAMKDKNWPDMLEELSHVAGEFILTQVPMERGVTPEVLKDALPSGMPVSIIEDPVNAMDALQGRAHTDEVILVTGSLYLIGRVRPLLLRTGRAQAVGAGV